MVRPAHSEHRHHWGLHPDLVYLSHGSFGACPLAVLEEQARLRALLESDPMDFLLPEGLRAIYAALGLGSEVRAGNKAAIVVTLEQRAHRFTLVGSGRGLGL